MDALDPDKFLAKKSTLRFLPRFLFLANINESSKYSIQEGKGRSFHRKLRKKRQLKKSTSFR